MPASRRLGLLAVFAVLSAPPLSGCLAVFSIADSTRKQAKEQPWLWALFLQGGVPPAGISGSPTLYVSPELQFPADALQVKQSVEAVPLTIDGTYVPVGAIYNVGPEDPVSEFPYSLRFDKGDVELRYTYNEGELKKAGLTEEFAGFYQERSTGEWKPVKRVSVDPETNSVTVFTNHMTPFVLTAVPASNGNLASAPACLAGDYPGGIGGSAGAQFTVLGAGFRYLKDRNYTVVQDQTWSDLGFEQAVGVATCNGDSECGTFAQHKLNTGTDYVVFTAHTNLDVYLMYDTRGGANLNDTSRDASWIATEGFTNTGRFIDTTDPMGRFRVYRKAYLQGETVRLHGNRRGASSGAIQTNYWLAIKRQGVSGSEATDLTCNSSAVPEAGLSVLNLRGVPGSNRVTLLWQNPDDARFGTAVIRRSIIAPPSLPTDGVAVSGSAPHAQAFVDTTVSQGTIYYYTVFAVDQNQNYHRGRSVGVRTGTDSDGDGLADSYESTTVYPTTQKTATGNIDSDADGTSDYDEVVAGTDPTNGDATAPTITAFTRTSQSPTTLPVLSFTLTATDNTGVTHYMTTLTNIQPMPSDARWVAAAPTNQEYRSSGSHQLYAWAKDAAGNVSAAVPSIGVQIDGIKVARNLYAGAFSSLRSFDIDAATGRLAQTGSVNLLGFSSALVVHPSGRFLYRANTDTPSVFAIHPSSGVLTQLTPQVGSHYGEGMIMHPSGSTLYVSVRGNWLDGPGYEDRVDVFRVDLVTGALTRIQQWVTIPNGFSTGLTRISIHPTGNWLYGHERDLYGLYTFSILEDGTLSLVSHTNSIGQPRSSQVHSSGRFLYFPGHLLGGAQGIYRVPLENGLPAQSSIAISTVSWGAFALSSDGRWAFKSTGYQLDTFAVDGASGALAATASIALPRENLFFEPDAMGRFLYASSGSDLVTYSTDPGTGGVGEVERLAVNDISALAIRHEHSANDPPGASAGAERWVQMNTGAVALHGHNSYDPDATQCSANKANYVTQWSFVSVPGGSARTDNDIANRNSLRNASFTPDVAGDYVLRLSFTDDPGTCVGSPRTSTATVKIKAGYFHTQSGDYETDNGSYSEISGNAPNPNASWALYTRDPVDYGIDSQWSLFKADSIYMERLCMQVVDYLFSACLSAAASLIFPPAAIAATAGCYYGKFVGDRACTLTFRNRFSWLNSCNSPLLTMALGWAWCNSRPALGEIPPNPFYSNVEIFRAHFFIPVYRRWRQTGQWSWWDYN